jgi:hypothetical protein
MPPRRKAGEAHVKETIDPDPDDALVSERDIVVPSRPEQLAKKLGAVENRE